MPLGARERRLVADARAQLHQADAAPASIAALVAQCSPKQRAFIEDGAKRKAALCTRRSGKSFGDCIWLLEGAEQDPGGLSVFIALSRPIARRVAWRALKSLDRIYSLGLRFGEQDGQLIVSHPNGHEMWLAGCPDASEIDKFRGAPIRRVVIDEAQAFGGYLRELIIDALEPSLMDQDGELVLSGTPGAIPVGLFYEATTGDGAPMWPTHRWTVLENTHIPHAAAWLDGMRVRNGWTEEHPTYRREYLGEWVRDEGALVYPYDGARNSFRGELPEGRWTYGIGVDLGASEHEAGTAFVAAAHRAGHPELYILEAQKWAGLIPSRIAAYLEGWIERYTFGGVKPRVVVDEGGLGKGYAEEWRRTYGLPVEAAKKTQKRGFIELVAGDMRSGVIRVDPYRARCLVDEWQVLTWDEAHEEPDDRFEDHASDAALYVCRALRPQYRPELVPPVPGSREALDAEQAALRADTLRKVREQQRDRWKHRVARPR